MVRSALAFFLAFCAVSFLVGCPGPVVYDPSLSVDMDSAADLDELRNLDSRELVESVPEEIQEGLRSDAAGYVSELVAYLTAGTADDAKKAKILADWEARNIYYDFDYYYDQTTATETEALDILASGKTVCAGYADLYRRLCQEAGIDAVVVSGKVKGLQYATKGTLGGHAWNLVQINASYYFVDVTWCSGNRYENGAFTAGDEDYAYLFIPPSLIRYTHLPEDRRYQLDEPRLTVLGFLAQEEPVAGSSALTEAFHELGYSIDTPLPAVVSAETGEVSLEISGPTDEAIAQETRARLYYGTESYDGYAFLQRTGGGFTLSARLPEAGYGKILFYWYRATEDPDDPLYRALGRFLYLTETAHDLEPFPVQYTAYGRLSVDLETPTVGNLTAGQQYEFVLSSPSVDSMAVKDDSADAVWTELAQDGSEFSGSFTVPAAATVVYVFAHETDSEEAYFGVLVYTVVGGTVSAAGAPLPVERSLPEGIRIAPLEPLPEPLLERRP